MRTVAQNKDTARSRNPAGPPPWAPGWVSDGREGGDKEVVRESQEVSLGHQEDLGSLSLVQAGAAGTAAVCDFYPLSPWLLPAVKARMADTCFPSLHDRHCHVTHFGQ